MWLSRDRASQLDGGIWLIGLGILFYTGYWWPGILFVIGVTSIVEGLVKGQGWYAFQGGFWCIAIGVWAMFHYNFALLFIAIGVSMVLAAIVRPPGFSKTKPYADHTMD